MEGLIVAPMPTHRSFKVLTGEIFDRLHIGKYAGFAWKRGRKYHAWHSVCNCKNKTEKIVSSHDVLGGLRSCGCLTGERAAEFHSTHGLTKGYSKGAKRIPEHCSFDSMTQRCTNENHHKYPMYGGAGIKICERWSGLDGLKNFYEDKYPRPKGTTLDRIDNNGDYTPENTRWATPAEQATNRGDNILININGKSHCLAEASRVTGIPRSTLRYRIFNGWGHDLAISTPPNSKFRKKE